MVDIPLNSHNFGPLLIDGDDVLLTGAGGTIGFDDTSINRMQLSSGGIEFVVNTGVRMRFGNGVGLAEFLISFFVPTKQYAATVAALAGLPLAAGTTAYATDGRKNGEGAGAGTGVLAFRDATNWIACDSGTVLVS